MRLAWTLLLLLGLFLVGCAAARPVVDPQAITTEGALATGVLEIGKPQTVYARVRIKAKKLDRKKRGPVNVALAMDTSGSMEGRALADAKRAATEMIDSLDDGDRIAIVAFHTKTEVLVASAELDADVRRSAKKAIASIRAVGTTDMAGGLSEALRQVGANLDPKGVNRVVLLGDGIPNRAASMENEARRAAERGIAITTLGLGLDYDEVLMGRLAQLSGGRYHYVDDSSKVAGLFRDEIDRLDNVYARQAVATITAGPGVRIDAVLNAADGTTGDSARFPLGDIARGDQRDLIVEMTVTPRKVDVPIELLDVAIAFEDAFGDSGKLEHSVYFGARASGDEGEIAKGRHPDVELSAALAKASATTLSALENANRGSYIKARELLTTGSDAARKQLARTPSRELEKLATNMRSTAADLPAEDRAQPAASSEGGYEFQDDVLESQTVKPAVKQRLKEVHSDAINQLQSR